MRQGLRSESHLHAFRRATRPMDLHGHGFLRKTEDQFGRILRPITAAEPNLVGRTKPAVTEHETDDRADGLPILFRALEMEPQSRFRTSVSIELRLAAVLSNDQIESPIVIEVA